MQKRVKTTIRLDSKLWHNLKVIAAYLGYRGANSYIEAQLEKLVKHLHENYADISKVIEV